MREQDRAVNLLCNASNVICSMETLGEHDSEAYKAWLDSVRRDGDEIPELIEVVAPEASAEASVNPTDVDDKCKIACAEAVEAYIAKCEEIMLAPLHAKEYLRLVPKFMPMKHVYVGQSSYNEAILPRYASAFAFDIAKCGAWTPSVQVLSQAMTLVHQSPLDNCLCLLANSFILITRSILMVNVFPYSSPDDHERAKLGPVFAEFLSELIMLSRVMGVKKIQVREFGDVAQEYCDMAWKSIKSSMASMRHVNLRNPMYVSRRYGISRPGDYGPDPSDLCETVSATLARVPQSPDSVAVDSKASAPPKWQAFTLTQLQGVAASNSLAQLHDYSSAESILSLTTEFVETATIMASRGKGQRQQRQPDPMDMGYTTATIVALSNTAREMMNRVESAYSDNKKAIDRLTPDDAEQASQYLETLQRLRDVMTTSVGMFASIHGTMVSDTPAVALNSASVPPMVRQVPPEAAEAQAQGRAGSPDTIRESASVRGSTAEELAESRRLKRERARARVSARMSSASQQQDTLQPPTTAVPTSTAARHGKSRAPAISRGGSPGSASDAGASQSGVSDVDVFADVGLRIVDTRIAPTSLSARRHESTDTQASAVRSWRTSTPQPTGSSDVAGPSVQLSPSIPVSPPASEFNISEANTSISHASPVTPSKQRAIDRRRARQSMTPGGPRT